MERKAPNILFILADDMGAWAMGCAGNGEVITPNLDSLAASGICFKNFFCASPVCSPARASILTGRMPSSHGVHDWLRSGNIDASLLTDEQRKIGLGGDDDKPIEYLRGMTGYTDVLAENGYNCALSGKWHLGDSHRPQKGITYWKALARGGCNYYGSDFAKSNGIYINGGYITDTITDNALGFLEELSLKEPFYLGVHYTAPHTPWNRDQHPARIWDLYEGCPFDSAPREEPHRWQAPTCQIAHNEEERKLLLRGYYTAITAMDENIGRLIKALEEKGLREDTLVVFMSDNGMNLGHHGIWGKGNGTFPLNMYDSSVKVPCIFSRPVAIKGGRADFSLLSQYDFLPTLLDYVSLGDKIPPKLPGKSFRAILDGSGKCGAGDEAVYVYDEYGPVRMIRDKNFKYVRRYPYGENELYDLISDPGERVNLIGDEEYKNLAAEYRHKLDVWFLSTADPAVDGAREDVTGFGQMNLAGAWGDGRPVYFK